MNEEPKCNQGDRREPERGRTIIDPLSFIQYDMHSKEYIVFGATGFELRERSAPGAFTNETNFRPYFVPKRYMHPGTVLTSGVDSIVLALDLHWRGDKFFRQLHELQQDARDHKRPAPGQMQTKDQAHAVMFEVLEHGSDGYQWIINSTEWSIKLGSWLQPQSRPNAMVTLRSESLWLHGVVESIDRLSELLRSVEGFIIRNRASRVDICTDIQLPEEMWHKDLIDYRVGHIRKNAIHLEFDRLEGFQLGKGKFLARIYDKPLEIDRISKKYWFYDIWKIEKVPEDQRIIRVEFQVRREGLKQLGVNTVWDFVNHPRSLWDYCTRWLQLAKNREALKRDRVLLPFWDTVQNGFLGGQSGAPFIRAKMIQVKQRQLDLQLIGQVTSLVAMQCTTAHPSVRIEDQSHLVQESAKRLGLTDAAFSERIRMKLAKRPREIEKFDLAQAQRAAANLPQWKTDDGKVA